MHYTPATCALSTIEPPPPPPLPPPRVRVLQLGAAPPSASMRPARYKASNGIVNAAECTTSDGQAGQAGWLTCTPRPLPHCLHLQCPTFDIKNLLRQNHDTASSGGGNASNIKVRPGTVDASSTIAPGPAHVAPLTFH